MITVPGVWKFYLSSSLFSATRMGIGATAVIYMLSKGVSLSDIALIKLIQGGVIFFAEVPTGLVADLLGRRFSSILAVICSICSFILFYQGSSVPVFIGAEIFNALAIAFWSGAFEALLVDSHKVESQQPKFLDYVFSQMNMYGAVATMLGGLIGGFIGTYEISFPFIFSGILGVLTILSIVFLIPSDRVKTKKQSSFAERFVKLRESLSENVRLSYQYGVSDKLLRSFFVLQIAIQFMYQPVFHYWQPYFKGFGWSESTDVLGIIFFAYVGMNFVVSFFVSQFVKKGMFAVHHLLVAELTLVTISFGLISSTQNFWIAVSGFLLMQGCGSNLRTLLNAGFNKVIPSEQRATILSSVSFISRIGMLAALGVIHIIAQKVDVSSLFIISLLGALMAIPIYISWNSSLNSKLKRDFCV